MSESVVKNLEHRLDGMKYILTKITGDKSLLRLHLYCDSNMPSSCISIFDGYALIKTKILNVSIITNNDGFFLNGDIYQSMHENDSNYCYVNSYPYEFFYSIEDIMDEINSPKKGRIRITNIGQFGN